MTIDFSFNNETILIVGKCKVHRFKLTETLLEHGCQVLEEASGCRALEIIREADAVILSERMSDMDAVQFLDHLDFLRLENPPRVLLIGSNLDRETAYKMRGVNSFLYSPFYPEMLALKLKALLHPKGFLKDNGEKVQVELRKYERIPVNEVMLSFLTPFRESARVVDICYSGMKVISEKAGLIHLGGSTRMQLLCQGKSMVLNGNLIWTRDGEAGIRFKGPKPPQFNPFLESLIQSDANEIDERLIKISHAAESVYGV